MILMGRKILISIFLAFSLLFPIIGGNGAQIVKINVGDSWVFTDGTSYTVTEEYQGRPPFANPNQLSAFHVEVATNESLFFLGAEVLSDIGVTLTAKINSFTLDHTLLSQRGAFLLYQSGYANVTAIVGDYASHTGVYYFNLFTRGQPPSVAVVNQEPVETEMMFIMDQSTDANINSNVSVIAIFGVNYVPSEEFTTIYNSTSVQAVNITATIMLKAFDVRVRDYGRAVELNEPVMIIERTYAIGIGLPISEKITRYPLSQDASLHEGTNKLNRISLGNYLSMYASKEAQVSYRELKSFSIRDSTFSIDNEKGKSGFLEIKGIYFTTLILTPLLKKIRK